MIDRRLCLFILTLFFAICTPATLDWIGGTDSQMSKGSNYKGNPSNPASGDLIQIGVIADAITRSPTFNLKDSDKANIQINSNTLTINSAAKIHQLNQASTSIVQVSANFDKCGTGCTGSYDISAGTLTVSGNNDISSDLTHHWKAGASVQLNPSSGKIITFTGTTQLTGCSLTVGPNSGNVELRKVKNSASTNPTLAFNAGSTKFIFNTNGDSLKYNLVTIASGATLNVPSITLTGTLTVNGMLGNSGSAVNVISTASQTVVLNTNQAIALSFDPSSTVGPRFSIPDTSSVTLTLSGNIPENTGTIDLLKCTKVDSTANWSFDSLVNIGSSTTECPINFNSGTNAIDTTATIHQRSAVTIASTFTNSGTWNCYDTISINSAAAFSNLGSLSGNTGCTLTVGASTSVKTSLGQISNVIGITLTSGKIDHNAITVTSGGLTWIGGTLAPLSSSTITMRNAGTKFTSNQGSDRDLNSKVLIDAATFEQLGSGTLKIHNDFTTTQQSTVTFKIFNHDGGAFDITKTTLQLTDTATLSSAGTTSITQSTTTISKTLNINTNALLSGGTLVLSTSNSNIQIQNGKKLTIDSSASITVGNSITASGLVMSPSSTLEITSSTMTILASTVTLYSLSLLPQSTNGATVTLDAGSNDVDLYNTISIGSYCTLNINSNFNWNSNNAKFTIANFGRLVLTGSNSNNPSSGNQFNVAGTLEIGDGSLLDTGNSETKGIILDTTGKIYMNGGTFRLRYPLTISSPDQLTSSTSVSSTVRATDNSLTLNASTDLTKVTIRASDFMFSVVDTTLSLSDSTLNTQKTNFLNSEIIIKGNSMTTLFQAGSPGDSFNFDATSKLKVTQSSVLDVEIPLLFAGGAQITVDSSSTLNIYQNLDNTNSDPIVLKITSSTLNLDHPWSQTSNLVATVTVTGSTLNFVEGTLAFNANSAITISGNSFLNLGDGKLEIQSGSTLTIKSTTITRPGGNNYYRITVKSGATLYVDGNIDTGRKYFDIEDGADVHVLGGTQITATSGFPFIDLPCKNYDYDPDATTQGISIASQGTLEISLDGCVVMNANAPIVAADNANITIADNGQLVTHQTTVTAGNGIFNTKGLSEVTFDQTNGQIGGSATLFGAFVKLESSTFSFGNLAVDNSTNLSLDSSSSITVNSGNTLSIVSHGKITSTGGDLTVDSPLSMDGYGSISLSSSSIGKLSTSTLSGNSYITVDSSELDTGDVTLDVNSYFELHTSSDMHTLGSLIFSGSNTYATVDGGSKLKVSTGSLSLTDSKLTVTQLNSAVNVENTLSLSSSTVTIDNSGSLVVSGPATTELTMTGSSKLLISGAGILSTSDTTFSLQNSANLTLDGSQDNTFTETIIDSSSTSSINLVNSAKLTLSSGSYEASNDAKIYVLSNSELSFSGPITLNDNVKVTINSGTASISQTTLTDTSEIILSSGDIDVASGSIVNLGDFSKIKLSSASNFIANGAFEADGNSTLSVDSSSITIEAASVFSEGAKLLGNKATLQVNGGLSLSGYTTLSFTDSSTTIQNSNFEIDGYCISDLTNSPILLNVGQFNIKGYSISDLSGSDISISAGTASFMESSITKISASDFGITGNAAVSDKALVQFSGNSKITADGSVTLSGDSNTELQSSRLDIANSLIATTNATLKLDSVSIVNLTSSNSIVSFDETCDLILLGQSNFVLTDGSTSFDGYSSFTVGGSSIVDISGLLEFLDHSTLTSTTSTVNVAGDFDAQGNTVITATSSSFNIINGGSMNLKGIANIVITNTPLVINGTATLLEGSGMDLTSSTLEVRGEIDSHGTSEVKFISSSTFDIIGILNAYDNSSFSFTESTVLLSGSADFYNDSTLSLLDSLCTFTVTGGTLTFHDNSKINVAGGNVLNIDNGAFVLRGSVRTIWDDIEVNIRGSLSVEENAYLSATNCDITVNGEITTKDNISFLIDTSTITVNGLAGKGIFFNGTQDSDHQFLDTTVSIESGALHFSGDVAPIFDHSTLTITSGDVQFKEQSSPNFISQSIISVGSGSQPVIFRDSSVPSFSDTNFSIIGRAIFQDFSIATFQSSTISIDGSLLFQNDVETYFYDTEVTVDSDTGGVEFKNSVHSVNNGGFFELNNGYLKLADDVQITFNQYVLTVNYGDVSFNGNAYIKFLDPSSTVTVQNGNFDLYESSNLITVPDLIISVRGGDFTVNDIVTLNFDIVTFNVGGNVEFHNSSKVISTGADYVIENGFFSLYDVSSFIASVGSHVSITNGDFVVVDQSTFSISNSQVEINSGNFKTNDLITFTSNLSQISVLGSAIFDGLIQSVHTFTKTSVVVNQGNIVFKGYIDPTIQSQSSFTVTGGIVKFSEYVNSTISDSSIDVDGGSVIFQDSSNTILHSSSITVDSSTTSGTVSIIGSSVFSLDQDSSVTVNGGDFQTNNLVTFSSTNSHFKIVGNLILAGSVLSQHTFQNSDINVSGGSVFITDHVDPQFVTTSLTVSGTVTIQDFTNSQFTQSSTISISGGNLIIQDNAIVSLITSPISISTSGGLLSLSDSAQFTVTNTKIDVLGGDLKTFEDIRFTVSNTDIIVAGSITFSGTIDSVHSFTSVRVIVNNGNIGFTQYIDPSFVSSSLTVNQGLVTIEDNTIATFSSTPISITKGSFFLKDDSHTTYTSQTITVDSTGGLLSVSENAYFNIDQTTVNVNGGDFKTFNNITLIVHNSVINVVGSITFSGLLTSTHSFSQVQVTVNNGDISFTEFIDPTFTGSSLTLNQGEVMIKDSSIASFSTTPISITQGSLYMSNDSQTTYTLSEISIDAAGGLLSVSDNAHFSISRSKVTVSGGKLQTLNNVSFLVTDTEISVSGSVYLSGLTTSVHDFTTVKMVVTGDVNFTESIDPVFTSSSLDVNEGSFTIDGSAKSSFSNSPITVNGGSILITDQTNSQLTDSSIKIRNGANLGGDLHIAVDSIVTFLRSPIFVEGGDINISDNADAYITDPTSTININMGNFVLSEHADLFTVPNSVINVNVGNFKVFDFVDLLFNKVTLNVAGTVEFHDDSKLSATAVTLISVVDGFFTANNRTIISLSNSKISLQKLTSGGNILLQDNSEFTSVASTIQIDSGSFIISQNTIFSTQTTDVQVNDGQFITQNEVQYSMTSSTLFVQGDVTLSGLSTSSHSFSTTTINVSTGNLLFTQDIDPSLTSSSIFVRDGLVTIEKNVQTTMTDTDTVIYGGSLIIKDNSKSLLTRSDILIDMSSSSQNTGYLSISDNSQFKILDSAIKVYGGDLKTFDHVDFEATSTNIEVVGNVRFSGYLDSTHKFDQVTVSVNTGNILFTQDIDPTFYQSNLIVNDGIITIESNVTSSFLNSNFSVYGGNFNILESSINSFSFVNILVDGGAKKRSEVGALIITDDSIFSIDHSTIVVKSGTIQTFKNIQFSALSTSIKVFGSIFFSGLSTSKYTFDDVPMTVESGQIKLSSSMQPVFSFSSVNVTGGSFTIEDSVNSTFNTTPILVDGGNFYFYNQTTTQVNNSPITVKSSGGVMLIESTSKLSINDSSVTITGGNLLTSDTIELISNNSPIVVNGNVKFSGVVASIHDFYLSPMSVSNGYVLFTQDVDPVFTESPIEISSGTFTIEKHTLANLFTSYVVIYGGQFYAKDNSTTNFHNSSLTVASTNGGLLSFSEFSVLTFEESPILMRGGDIVGRDYSDFYILDPTTTLTIQSGNFLLYDHADFFTVQNTRISVVRGNFKVYNFVSIDFDQLYLTVFGLFEIFDDSNLNFLDSQIDINEGTYTANVNSNMKITTTQMSVVDGSFLTYDNCVFESYSSFVNISKDAKSKKIVKGGIFSGYDHSTLIFSDSSISVDGFFSNFDHANFTCKDTDIVVLGGDFLTADYSTFTSFSSQISINDGYFIVRNYSSFESENSSINITGSFVNEDNILFLLSKSSISIYSGTFTTTDNIDFTSQGSNIHVEGNVLLGGTSLSTHTFQNTNLEIAAGNLTFLNYVTPSVVSTNVTISGGFYEALDYSHITFSQTFLSLEGVGTLVMLDHSYWALKDSSLAQVVSDGATAIFCDYSIFEVFSDSTFNITNGNITFCGRSKLNLYPNTNFNLLDGTFTLSGKSVMVAYQNTKGEINGGNMNVIDDATLIFVQSNLIVKGAINHSSSVPIQLLDSTSIIVNGSPITVSGNGVITISSGALLEVLDNSLILDDNASIITNNGVINVQGGSILANDQSSLIATNETTITVTAGNITTAGESSFSASSETIITISATADSIGQLFITQQSTFSMNSAFLNVNNGNIFVSQDGALSAENNTAITVSGNITFLDTSYLSSDSSTINVISGGNLIASGVGIQLDFTNSIVNVIGGDIISTIRSEIYVSNSQFVISAGGSLSLSDLTFTQFTHNSQVIVEGGDLLLSRQAILSITDYSAINVTSGGSVIYRELSQLYLSTYAGLNVINGGSISFYDNSTLVAQDHSEAFVEGGGNIDIHNYARVLLSSSSLTVLSGGGIQFFNHAETSLRSNSLLFVQGGGDISFSDATSLECVSSSVKVTGGSVIFSGTGEISFKESAILEVQSGNVEFHHSKTIAFSGSAINILGGNLISTDDSVFTITSSSIATISGGFFSLQINSQLSVDTSSIIIESGGVTMENNSKANINAGSIEITNTLSGTGNFLLQDSVVVIIQNNSLLSVTGGNFALSSTASLTSEDSGIAVVSGSALFYGDVQYSGTRSTVIVSGSNSVYGTLEIYGNSVWDFYENSLAKVESGSLLIYDSTSVTTDDSQFVVTNGDCLVYGSSYFSMRKSVLSVTGGNLQYSEQTTFKSELSDITVRGGQVIYDNNVQISMQQTNLTVDKNLARATGNNDLIIIKGDSTFEATQNSIIQTSLGNLVFAERANSTISNSAIIVDGGNMKQTSNSFSTVTNTTAEISSGSFEVIENSQIIIQSQSNFKIIGGNFNVFNNPIFNMKDSSITVSAGLVHFTGGSISFITSNLLVNENGSMLFAGNSFVNFVTSNITLDGKGIFTITDQTKVYVSLSTIKIRSGSFSSLGTSSLFISDSIYDITGGNTVYGGSSSINVQNSIFSISGGDVSFTDNSAVFISGNSVYSVTGGNVITSGSTHLSLSDSCFNLTQGIVSYSGSSAVDLVNSCWNINGGNAYFTDDSTYSLSSNSKLNLVIGSIEASDSASISVSDSGISILGGSYSLGGGSEFKLVDSFVSIFAGAANWKDNSNSFITNSSFSVSGGVVNFSGSSHSTWTSSSILTVIKGDILMLDRSTTEFSDSTISILSGSLQFHDFSFSNFTNVELLIKIGSVNFIDNSECYFKNVDITIPNGNLQYTDNSNVIFDSSTVLIKNGMLELLNEAEVVFVDSTITLAGGSISAQNQVNVNITNCDLSVVGTLYAQNKADMSIFSSSIEVTGGDIQLLDEGSFSVFDTTIDVYSGNMIVNNPTESTRKEVTFSASKVNVHRNTQDLSGNFNIDGNVDVTLLGSDFTIDGNLQMFSNAKLNVFRESNFNIPTGVVTMDQFSSIEISEDSAFLNQGTLFAPGKIGFPTGSSVQNSGFMHTDHALSVNCESESSPFHNSGTLSIAASGKRSCLGNVNHTGFMQISGGNITLGTFSNTRGSTVTLTDSVISFSGSVLYTSVGSFGGSGRVEGNFDNKPGAVIMGTGDAGTTNLFIANDFTSSGTMFFMINSRNLSEANAITTVNAGLGVQLTGGRACVCLSPTLELIYGDKWDLVNAATLLDGKFDTVEFGCVECPSRAARSVQSTEQTCEPTTDYSTRSFSVLFESCGGGSGSNFLTSITPPYYVIIPVAVGIILILVVVFGGALFIDERVRKYKFQKKSKSKRSNRIKEMRNARGSQKSESSQLI